MDEKDKIFIKLLEYGALKELNGSSLDDALEWAKKSDYISKKNKNEAVKAEKRFIDLFYECFTGGRGFQLSDDRKAIGVLKAEYYFRLIEYKELQEARRTAKKANITAWVAIIFSLITFLSASFFTYMQLNTPIKIDPVQMEQLLISRFQ